MPNVHDLIIIGAGPAGLSAGVYACELRLDTLILEANSAGGQPATLYPKKTIYDYPPESNILAGDLARKMVEHAINMGAVVKEHVTVYSFKKTDMIFELATGNDNYYSKSVLLAIGMGFFKPRRLGVPGEDLPGVYHKFPNPREYEGKKVLCVGGGDTAFESALAAIKSGARKVFLVHRRDKFRAVEKTLEELRKKNVEFLTPCELLKINDSLRGKIVNIYNNKTNKQKEIKVDMVCIHIGFMPDSSLVEQWGLAIASRAVVVDRNLQTSKEGIFACGDVTIPVGEYKRITIAQGQAAQAVHGAYKYLKRPYWK